MIDQPMISTVMFGAAAVIPAPRPNSPRPMRKASRRPMMSPILPPIIISAAIVSVYVAIASCIFVTVVSRSSITFWIDTFMTVLSSTMMNWAEASAITTAHLKPVRLPVVAPFGSAKVGRS